jgi:hypothetical protein
MKDEAFLEIEADQVGIKSLEEEQNEILVD